MTPEDLETRWGLTADAILKSTDWLCTGDGVCRNSPEGRRNNAEHDLIRMYRDGCFDLGGMFVREVTTTQDDGPFYWARERHELEVYVPPVCATKYGTTSEEKVKWEELTEEESEELQQVFRPMQPVDLYRFYSAARELLYVGKSLSTFRRVSQHRSKAGWWREVKYMEREEIAARDIDNAEREAIVKENPKYNVIWKVKTAQPKQAHGGCRVQSESTRRAVEMANKGLALIEIAEVLNERPCYVAKRLGGSAPIYLGGASVNDFPYFREDAELAFFQAHPIN